MLVTEIATRLHDLCQNNENDVAYNELFNEDATSTEPNMAKGGQIETVSGMPAIKEKAQIFYSMLEEVHGGYANKPSVFGNHIFMEMGMDATMKGMGRMEMKEMAHYVVADGKIISQQFYY